MKKGIAYTTIGMMVSLALMALRPVPKITEKEALITTGIITEISATPYKDILIKLNNTDTFFYINRGVDLGLKHDVLEKKLLGNTVQIKYPAYWTPLDWQGKSKHLSQITLGNEIIFTELKE
ncbi:hypothetical protein [Echinicola rosea]|uniref:Uncharacterized protein n=1 Tax=Echinicola rosea TaxID=1807691 RepID=A0ABQ1VCZ7_9BACT|nr:hypothetical protein [Echinicola rosea]GGF49416.1 hypothetical protein GCM10011339_42540 [Echinicola rosea]